MGAFVVKRRNDIGMSPKQFAAAIGKGSAYVSQLEGGKISLPGGEMRRRIAQALGVSHLDILKAAGEITDEELEATGIVGVKPDFPPGSEQIHSLVNQIVWTERRITWFTTMLTEMIEVDNGGGDATARRSTVVGAAGSSR